MNRQSIFLSGWEYNRLLYDDPIQARNSGIPAEVLWQGSAHFWLFDKVLVTREAFRGDLSASETLGWSSGKIFEELIDLGFIELVDIEHLCKSDPILGDKLKLKHSRLRREHGGKLTSEIAQGNWPLLEELKTDLLSPILSKLGCTNSISYNSIKTWTEKKSKSLAYPNPIIASLAEKFQPSPINASLTRFPGSGVPDEAKAAQARVQQEIEARIIFDLIESRISHETYEQELKPHKDAYKPISDQLMSDFKVQLDDLLRLRELASKLLWKNLHEDWIPDLKSGTLSHQKFLDILNRALNQSVFDRFKRGGVSFAFEAVKSGVVAGGAALLGPAGASLGHLFNKGVTENVQKHVDKKLDSELEGFENLLTFAQQAKSFRTPSAP